MCQARLHMRHNTTLIPTQQKPLHTKENHDSSHLPPPPLDSLASLFSGWIGQSPYRSWMIASWHCISLRLYGWPSFFTRGPEIPFPALLTMHTSTTRNFLTFVKTTAIAYGRRIARGLKVSPILCNCSRFYKRQEIPSIGVIGTRRYYSNHNPKRIIITEHALQCILQVVSPLVCFTLWNWYLRGMKLMSDVKGILTSPRPSKLIYHSRVSH